MFKLFEKFRNALSRDPEVCEEERTLGDDIRDASTMYEIERTSGLITGRMPESRFDPEYDREDQHKAHKGRRRDL